MDEKFEKMEKHALNCLTGDRPYQEKAVSEIVELWRKLYLDGVTPYDFAHALLDASHQVMLTFESMEQSRQFGEFSKKSAQSLVRSIDTHWPRE